MTISNGSGGMPAAAATPRAISPMIAAVISPFASIAAALGGSTATSSGILAASMMRVGQSSAARPLYKSSLEARRA
ncbi:MAG TPA: hypothetical protein VGN98_13015 [Tianweitania sediminis]|nr:hypothetical protein [Tianweitania sediminis]